MPVGVGRAAAVHEAGVLHGIDVDGPAVGGRRLDHGVDGSARGLQDRQRDLKTGSGSLTVSIRTG